jgi:hypothetical protein
MISSFHPLASLNACVFITTRLKKHPSVSKQSTVTFFFDNVSVVRERERTRKSNGFYVSCKCPGGNLVSDLTTTSVGNWGEVGTLGAVSAYELFLKRV